jgi:hypothetical protein
VVLTAFETSINYARYLPNDAAVISNFLGAFFGTRYSIHHFLVVVLERTFSDRLCGSSQ